MIGNFFFPWNVKWPIFSSWILISIVTVRRAFAKLFSVKREINVWIAVNRDFSVFVNFRQPLLRNRCYCVTVTGWFIRVATTWLVWFVGVLWPTIMFILCFVYFDQNGGSASTRNFCSTKNVLLFFREAWNAYFIFHELRNDRFIFRETRSRPHFTSLFINHFNGIFCVEPALRSVSLKTFWILVIWKLTSWSHWVDLTYTTRIIANKWLLA